MGATPSSFLGSTITYSTKFIFRTLANRLGSTGSYGIAIASAVIITNAGWIFTMIGHLIGKVVYIMVVSKIIYFVFEAVKTFKGNRQQPEVIVQRQTTNKSSSTLFNRISIPWEGATAMAASAVSTATQTTSSIYERGKNIFSNFSFPMFGSNLPSSDLQQSSTKDIITVQLKQSSINSHELSSIDHEQLQRQIERFKCPLTNILMKIPTSLKCGHEFEKQAISKHLKKEKKCPVCSQKAVFEDLREVRSAKISIDNIMKKQALKIKRALEKRMKEFGDQELSGQAVQFKLIPKEK